MLSMLRYWDFQNVDNEGLVEYENGCFDLLKNINRQQQELADMIDEALLFSNFELAFECKYLYKECVDNEMEVLTSLIQLQDVFKERGLVSLTLDDIFKVVACA